MMGNSGTATVDEETIEKCRYVRHRTKRLRNGVHPSDSLGWIDHVLNEVVESVRYKTKIPWSRNNATFIDVIEIAFKAHVDDGGEFR